MTQNNKPVLIYVTAPSGEIATAISEALVEQRLVACANILPGMTAIYFWQGQLNRDTEVVVLLKTMSARVRDVIAAIRSHHPYDNPAIAVLPILDGSPDFLAWIAANTGPDAAL